MDKLADVDVSSVVTVIFFFLLLFICRFNFKISIRTTRLADMIRSADSIKMPSVVFFFFFRFFRQSVDLLQRLLFLMSLYRFHCHCYNNSVDLTLSLVYCNFTIRLKCKTVVCTNTARDIQVLNFLIFLCDFIIAWLPANALLLYTMYIIHTAVLSTHPDGSRCKDKTIFQSGLKII